jgi:hypothetical protein
VLSGPEPRICVMRLSSCVASTVEKFIMSDLYGFGYVSFCVDDVGM